MPSAAGGHQSVEVEKFSFKPKARRSDSGGGDLVLHQTVSEIRGAGKGETYPFHLDMNWVYTSENFFSF